MAVASLAALGPLSVALAIGLGTTSALAGPPPPGQTQREVPAGAAPKTDTPGLPPGARPALPTAEPEGRQPIQPDEPHRLMITPRPAPGAPAPGEAHGARLSVPERQGWKWVPRTILFLPKWTIELATYPIYLSIIAYRKYGVRERVTDVFFNDARTFGIFPTIFAETGFGANIGLRLVHRNLFGRGESLRLRAGWGGLWQQVYEADVGTGDRLSDNVSLRMRGGYEILPRQRFFGIGNDDELDLTAREAEAFPPVDPVQPFGAIDTRYRSDIGTWTGLVRLDLSKNAGAQFGHRWQYARFDDPVDAPDAIPLDEVYDTTVLTGWSKGLLNHYTELSLSYDDTEIIHPWLPKALPSRGWRLRAYGGFAEAPRDPTQYFTSGFEVQRFFNIYRGDRVLNLRLVVDAVHGVRHRIPFIEYPTLGGPDYLRGYTRDRFRDRFATLASAEYNYPINEILAGYLFIDTGRVWPRPYVLPASGFDDLRLGFGGGLNIMFEKTFVARVQAASSIDGGFFIDFRLNPTRNIRGTF